jgi:hypothetical protein
MKTRVWFSLILIVVLTLSLAAVAPPLMARTISVDATQVTGTLDP